LKDRGGQTPSSLDKENWSHVIGDFLQINTFVDNSIQTKKLSFDIISSDTLLNINIYKINK
jgi:hypothetical protein